MMMVIHAHTIARLFPLVLSISMSFMVVEVGDPIPAFRLKTPEGQVFDSKQLLSGKVAIVSFWRLEQMFADRLLEDLQTLHEETQSKGVVIVAICSGAADPAQVSEVVRRLGLKYPVLLDPDRKVYGDFGVFVSPSTAFVAKGGELDFYYASYRPDFLHAARTNVRYLLGEITAADRAERIDPKRSSVESEFNPAEPRFNLGMQYLKAGNWTAAKTELMTAWKSEAFKVPAGIELGLLSLRDGKSEEAIEFFSGVIERDPDNVKAMGGMGVAFIKVGKVDTGKEMVQQAFAAGLREAIVFYELGQWCEKEGVCDEALKHFKKGLEIALRK